MSKLPWRHAGQATRRTCRRSRWGQDQGDVRDNRSGWIKAMCGAMWDRATCGLMETARALRRNYCVHLIGERRWSQALASKRAGTDGSRPEGLVDLGNQRASRPNRPNTSRPRAKGSAKAILAPILNKVETVSGLGCYGIR
jgi:hypothetical protein